jgi:hypothetical protein
VKTLIVCALLSVCGLASAQSYEPLRLQTADAVREMSNVEYLVGLAADNDGKTDQATVDALAAEIEQATELINDVQSQLITITAPCPIGPVYTDPVHCR